jgi:hypothetical protein
VFLLSFLTKNDTEFESELGADFVLEE